MKPSALWLLKKLVRLLPGTETKELTRRVPLSWAINIAEYRKNHPETSLSDGEILKILESKERS